MSAPRMNKKHQKDAQTIDIEAQNASIRINKNQTLKIIYKKIVMTQNLELFRPSLRFLIQNFVSFLFISFFSFLIVNINY